MNIEEEDIFNFVYNPEILDDAKRSFISTNTDKFANELNFYTLLKEQQNIPVPKKIVNEIIEKINSYNHPKLKFLKKGNHVDKDTDDIS